MSQKLQNHKIEFEKRLNEFVNSVPEFVDPKVRHHKFLSYDQTEQEESLYEFWRDTVHSLISKVFQTTYATPDQIWKWFCIEGKKPIGLANVLLEMKLRNEFILKADILDESHYTKKGWLSQQFSKALSFFSSAKTEELNMNQELVSVTWLEDIWTSVTNWAFWQEKQLFELSTVEQVLKESGCNREDVKIVIIHLRNTNRMIGDKYVKIGEKDKIEPISNAELTDFRLNSTVKDLDVKIADLQHKISVSREKAKEALRNNDKAKATSFVREKKNLEMIETTLRGMQMKIEKQIIDINIHHHTKDTLDVLKLSTAEQNIADEDIEEAEDLMDKITEQNFNASKISEMFANSIDDEIDESELLKELELDQDEDGNNENLLYGDSKLPYKSPIDNLVEENDDQPINEFECSHVTPEKVDDKYRLNEEKKVVFA